MHIGEPYIIMKGKKTKHTYSRKCRTQKKVWSTKDSVQAIMQVTTATIEHFLSASQTKQKFSSALKAHDILSPDCRWKKKPSTP